MMGGRALRLNCDILPVEENAPSTKVFCQMLCKCYGRLPGVSLQQLEVRNFVTTMSDDHGTSFVVKSAMNICCHILNRDLGTRLALERATILKVLTESRRV
jgi:hypothetical protein